MAKGVATLEELVLARHKLPMWAAFTELRSGTGYGRDGERSVEQRFDVVAFNCWPSKKGLRVAYEIKRSRSDFLRELSQPEKRDQVEQFFHETWFVASHGVCDRDEIPYGWGLLVRTKKGDKLRSVRRPRARDPEPVPYWMMMSVLRSACRREHELPTFDLDGREVSSHDLERLVSERVREREERLAADREALREERAKLIEERADLLGPLRHLYRKANGLVGVDDDSAFLSTSDAAAAIDNLIDRAARRRASRIAHRLAAAREEIEAIEITLRRDAD